MRSCLTLLIFLLVCACAHVPEAAPVVRNGPVATVPPPPPSLELVRRQTGRSVALRAAPRRVETAVRLPAPAVRPVARAAVPTRDVRSLFPRTKPASVPSDCDT